ncbi:MAG: hypothetical protein NVS2B7_21870 [Herpetosiphon sp.]
MTQRAPYGRATSRDDRRWPPSAPRYDDRPGGGETYYDRPAVKASHWGWLIVVYFWIGGIAGAAQILATIADLLGRERHRPVVRAGRYIALVGSLASPVLLIADLHTPGRWYNMVRIFRRTSMMSIGSWTLVAFGSLSGAAGVGQLLEDLFGLRAGRSISRGFGLPAALSGTMMSLYTGALLSTTSTPLWSTADELLPALFAASATTTAAASLSLLGEALGTPSSTLHQLDQVALVAGSTEFALALATDRRLRRVGVAGALDDPRYAPVYRIGAFGMGILVPLAIHAYQLVTGHRSRAASRLAAISALAGGFALRAVWVFAGNESAHRPRDYFRTTQPVGANLMPEEQLHP